MNLIRLERHQHPCPPHQELRQKSVFDSGVRHIGQVANLYVDDDRELQFVDVPTSGFLGLGKKHHLVPAEAIAEESAGAVTLAVDQQTVESAPTLADSFPSPTSYTFPAHSPGPIRPASPALAAVSSPWPPDCSAPQLL